MVCQAEIGMAFLKLQLKVSFIILQKTNQWLMFMIKLKKFGMGGKRENMMIWFISA